MEGCTLQSLYSIVRLEANGGALIKRGVHTGINEANRPALKHVVSGFT
jgi:hypothetical protein